MIHMSELPDKDFEVPTITMLPEVKVNTFECMEMI